MKQQMSDKSEHGHEAVAVTADAAAQAASLIKAQQSDLSEEQQKAAADATSNGGGAVFRLVKAGSADAAAAAAAAAAAVAAAKAGGGGVVPPGSSSTWKYDITPKPEKVCGAGLACGCAGGARSLGRLAGRALHFRAVRVTRGGGEGVLVPRCVRGRWGWGWGGRGEKGGWGGERSCIIVCHCSPLAVAGRGWALPAGGLPSQARLLGAWGSPALLYASRSQH